MLTCPSCGSENREGSRFCNECGTSLSAPGALRDVRKIVTALFCDLVGSTSLGETHDPETLRPVLGRYFEEMRSAVERHGGRVEKFIGDAVVAIFGLPDAHEDDGIRAVRAGLEMQQRLRAFNDDSPIALEARIGITTGEVLVAGGDAPILGDAMNTASRLQSAAEPGDVLVGEPTWRLVRGAVTAEALEPVHAKGKAEPVPAWRIFAVHAVVRSTTAFFGRDRHMRMLDEALTDAIAARAGVLVTVLAPPGVGKSRLAAAFASEAGRRATAITGQTPSYGEGVTFAPLAELLAQVAGRPTEEPEEIAAILREIVAGEPDGPSVGDRLAQILGVGDALGADPAWAVRRLLEVIAATRPHIVVLEDAHWAEPPMLDLTEAVVERVHGPVLFVCLARPELLEQRPTWAAGKPRAATITLPPLSPDDTRRMAQRLLGEGTPASVVDRVCETAEGNPLFLEQLTAMLADQGLLVDGVWKGAEDAEVEIPGTLQALLAARLDRLDPVPRLLIERASVEGRRFRVAAVQALTPEVEPDAIASAFVSLDRGDLVQLEDEAVGRWRFTHALVLEAAYRGLSKTLRAELHEQLAGWLQREDADQADVDERAARHLERALHLREELGLRDDRTAELSARSGALYAQAGLRAFAAVDLVTSCDLLGRAALLLPEADPKRLDLLPNLGVALTETGRPDETEALLTAAVVQSRAAGLERDALRATIQLLSNRIFRSATDAEIDVWIAQAMAAADALETMGDEIGLAEASIALEYLEFMRGRVAESYAWTLRALRHGLATGRFRESAQAAADVVGMAIFGPLPVDGFGSLADELLSLPGPIAACAGHALRASAALAIGDETGFGEHEGRWREVGDRNGLGWLVAAQGLVMADVEIHVGRAEDAERRLRESRDVLIALGDVWWVSTLDGLLGAALAAQGRSQEFLRFADSLGSAGPVPDPQNLIQRSLIRSRSSLLRGSAVDAELVARHGVELAERTDLSLDHVSALRVLAEALDARGLSDEAAGARRGADERLRAKGVISPPGARSRA